MKSMLLSALRDRTRIRILDSYRKYMEYTNNLVDICAVWVQDDNIAFETSLTRGVVPKNDNACTMIRKTIGQNMLMTFGIPSDDSKIPLVILLPFPSLLFNLGYKSFVKFLSEWKGNSLVGGIEVVRYSVLIGKTKTE